MSPAGLRPDRKQSRRTRSGEEGFRPFTKQPIRLRQTLRSPHTCTAVKNMPEPKFRKEAKINNFRANGQKKMTPKKFPQPALPPPFFSPAPNHRRVFSGRPPPIPACAPHPVHRAHRTRARRSVVFSRRTLLTNTNRLMSPMASCGSSSFISSIFPRVRR